MLLGFEDYECQARGLAQALGMPLHVVGRHRFPDGETRLTLPPRISGWVIVCRSLDHPDAKLVEMLLTARTARELGAERLTLVAPYLCYMRQDKAFNPGEAVSQPIIGAFLADLFDDVVTVDPHLHRIRELSQAVPAERCVTLTATGLMAEFLRGRVDDPLLIGPDAESEQWVRSVAQPGGWDFGVCRKHRKGDRDVDISLPQIDLAGRHVILVDDVASSGQTLAVAARQCRSRQARQVDVLVTHALLRDDATKQLADAGVRHVWSTDSVSHASNAIALQAMIGDALAALAPGR